MNQGLASKESAFFRSNVKLARSLWGSLSNVARLSRNQMLVQAVSQARCQMERIMYAAIDIDYYGETPAREHREILKTIQDRDPERARQRMYEHIVQSKDKVLGLTGLSVRRR